MRAAMNPLLMLGLAALFALAAFAGTTAAYTPLSARPIADIVLAMIWLVAAAGWLARRQRPALSLDRLALMLVAVVIAITLLAIPFADPISRGLESVRLSVWPLSAVLLFALSPWARSRREQILPLALTVTGLALAYSALRHLIGPSGLEEELARAALPGVPDQLAVRFYGSMPTAQQLAIYAATSLPIALMAAVSAGDRRRWIYALVVALAVFAVVASEVRTGAIAAVVASLTAIGLFAAASSFPRDYRRRAAVIAVAGVAVVGTASYVAVVANDEDRADRFGKILDPASDESISARLERWEDAVPLVIERPLGAGLGTSGLLAAEQPASAVAAANLDNDYLKVGIEQGPAAMLALIATLLALGLALVRRARCENTDSAALGAGAAGALAGLCVMAMTAFSFEQLQALPVWLLIGLALSGLEREAR